MYMSLEGAKVTRRKRNRVRQAHRHMYTHAMSRVYVNMSVDERGQWNWVLKGFH